MKGFKFAVVIIGILFLLSVLLFIFEFRETFRLKKEIAEKTARIREVEEAREEIDNLQKDIIGLKLESARIEKRIPYNEEQPLKLIRELTLLGSEAGLRNLEFFSGEERREGLLPESPGSTMGGEDSGGTTSQSDVREDSDTTSSQQVDQTSQPALSSESSLQVKPLSIKMTFECEFPRLISFLKEISELERLVSIEQIKIERSEKILPRQKVTLKLVAYTFLTD